MSIKFCCGSWFFRKTIFFHTFASTLLGQSFDGNIMSSPLQTESQIDHVMIDGRYFSDILDVRTYESDHYLVMVKMRPKLSVVNSVRYRRPPRVNLARLKEPDVAEAYAQRLDAALPEKDFPGILLEGCWNQTIAAITSVAKNCPWMSREGEC